MQNRWNRVGAAGAAVLLCAAASIQAGAAKLTFGQGMAAVLAEVVNAVEVCSEADSAPMPQVAESPLPEAPRTQAEEAPPAEPAPQPKIKATPQEISMIEHVVEREVHSASYAHKKAIANVIVNRVLAPQFPDTVEAVVHAPGQFPVSIKNYYNPKWKPDADTINAVYAAFYEPDTTGGALYFYAPQYTKGKTARWFENKLQYCFEMEGHRFFC